MLQLHLSDQQSYCLLRCDLYQIFNGTHIRGMTSVHTTLKIAEVNITQHLMVKFTMALGRRSEKSKSNFDSLQWINMFILAGGIAVWILPEWTFKSSTKVLFNLPCWHVFCTLKFILLVLFTFVVNTVWNQNRSSNFFSQEQVLIFILLNKIIFFHQLNVFLMKRIILWEKKRKKPHKNKLWKYIPSPCRCMNTTFLQVSHR